MKKGVKKLPVGFSSKEAILLYKKLAVVNKIVGKLDVTFKNSILNTTLISLLSYNESVQSTRIEGTQVTFSEIMEIKEIDVKRSWQQQEVLNYKNAIDFGFNRINHGQPISTRLIKELHEILMKNARGTTSHGGQFRKIQNFIGPDNNIENASYIPVSAEKIDEYMTNLEFFINAENHNSFEEVGEFDDFISYESDILLRIAVAHAQFESIHPFLDGNGRLGRILIALFAVKEQLVSLPLFFVSEELEKERIRYYNALNETRGDNPNWFNWLMFFLNASERMCHNIIGKIERAESLARVGIEICKTSAQKEVWLETFQSPIVTASVVAKRLNIHQTTAKKALDLLTEHHLLDKDSSVKRNVKYYNYDLLRVIQ